MDQRTHATLNPKDQLASAGGGRQVRGRALAMIIVALMLTLLLQALDATIVGTALPKIISQLHGFNLYSWVFTAYLLASAAVVPLISKLTDQFGRKWFLVAGIVCFLLGSALCGTVQTMDQLIAFRALQGLGAGVGLALVFTVVGDLFPAAERARWAGLFTGIYGLASIIGPPLGGWLTDHGPLLGSLVTEATRWHWIFFVNLPLGTLAVMLLLLFLPATLPARKGYKRGWEAVRRIDFAGAICSTLATVGLLLGLTWGSDRTYAWNSPQVLVMLGGAGLLFLSFFVAERFAAEPILPLKLLRNQVFVADACLALLTSMLLLALALNLPLFLQSVLGQSATVAGAMLIPLMVSFTIGTVIAGFTISATKRYQLVVMLGAAIMTGGTLLIARMTSATQLLDIGIFLVITGLGLGVFFAMLSLVAQLAVPHTQLGVATGAIRYLQTLGQALGPALMGTIVNLVLAGNLTQRLPTDAACYLTPAEMGNLANPQLLLNAAYRQTLVRNMQEVALKHIPAGPQHDALAQQALLHVSSLLDQIFVVVKQVLASSLQQGFVAVLALSCFALIASFFLKDLPFPEEKTRQQEVETVE
ncbi:MDR family MFS transporter [Ktedonosporobacter rubrisoli]|uniref:MDR family MFS transporter n=1 Tax=Ktedonosporobacter rubrisoli TaxID=2509675 RepID=UPI0013EE8BD4|nr:MDR family MFS transporter [Ktedonosporobacter rubrisoli]